MSAVPVEETIESPRAQRAAIACAVRDELPPFDDPAPGWTRSVTGEVLHASRSRPVVRWIVTDTCATETTEFSVVGKVYGRGGGAAAFDLLMRLRRGGFGGAFDVPEAIAYLPDRKLLLQSEAPPNTLHDGLADLAASIDDVHRTGQWLARLHAVEGTNLRPLAADFEAAKAEQYISALSDLDPALTRPLRRIQDDLMVALAASGAGDLVVTHGDFQQKNVHVDRDRIVVIDFDRAALAPAARDLGHFVGQALTMAASAGHSFEGPAREWALALFDGYLAAGGSPLAVEQSSAYVARTFLEVLFYRLVVRPMRDVSFVGDWVTECTGWLTQTVAVAR